MIAVSEGTSLRKQLFHETPPTFHRAKQKWAGVPFAQEKSHRRSKRVFVCVFCVSGFANLVHRHNHQRTSPRVHDQLAHRRELCRDRHARVLQRVHSNGLARYRWVIRPYLVHEVAGGGREAVQGENTRQNKKRAQTS